jgi:hypothetical protein
MPTAPTRRVHRVTAWITVSAVWRARVLHERGLCLGVLLRRDAAQSPRGGSYAGNVPPDHSLAR